MVVCDWCVWGVIGGDSSIHLLNQLEHNVRLSLTFM